MGQMWHLPSFPQIYPSVFTFLRHIFQKQICANVFLFVQLDELAENTGDECDYDCESFIPFDLMSFARQVARGMVRNVLSLVR